MTVLADTPVGVLHKGDVIWYQRRKRREYIVEWAVATNLSTLTPTVVFARNGDGVARCVPIDKITRIQEAADD